MYIARILSILMLIGIFVGMNQEKGSNGQILVYVASMICMMLLLSEIKKYIDKRTRRW